MAFQPEHAHHIQHAPINDPKQWLTYVPQTLARLSPLYAQLYQQMQQDQEIFSLLALIDPNQPIPVVFFTTINFLVLRHPQHAFAHFYPYLTKAPKSPEQAYPAFKHFCHIHMNELRALLLSVSLQTNEVTRCANLLPALSLVSTRGEQKPLALIEIGSSAGLNLNWRSYGYTYDVEQTHQKYTVGNALSPVQIACTLEGETFPSFPIAFPTVAYQVGIDLSPLDCNNERDVQKLRSCIWPEEQERYHVLDAAIAMARQSPPPLLVGNACDLLPDLLATIPPEQTLCIEHSFALNQGPEQVREQVLHILLAASQQRAIYRLSLEAHPLKEGRPRLELFTYRHGDLLHYEWLAECDFHGERMKWLSQQ